jgi:hypothetical protein
MKLKPAYLLLVLATGTAIFLGILWNNGSKEKVCCKEIQEPVQKTGFGSEYPTGSLSRLIASAKL